ncbi:splicing factor, suppressor of white-apricot [Dorcoceras hygrometricum]|nr:splicing factor, suppressor of white-apricot [Dorcoceras hygrometricum]
MDLQVVGRHVMLFDDDATADFVNSSGALVEWYSLQIDRYDVRHLFSGPPPPRRRNRNSPPVVTEDPALESQIDRERYLDLPSHSDQPEVEECEKPSNGVGYNAVSFSYGEKDYSADPKKADAEMEFSGFVPPFPIPETLLQSLVHSVEFSDTWSKDVLPVILGCRTQAPCVLFKRALQPPTEKVHQIIARTAVFVNKHGGQSEIILRVKQGDNPTFGFLMPDHQLHSYFRFLVEHPQLLQSEHNRNSQVEVKDVYGEHHNTNGVGGALSLLGSVYGSGEEEDGYYNANTVKEPSQDNSNSGNNFVSYGSKEIEFNADVSKKDVLISRSTTSNIKEKVLSVKKNTSHSASKSGNTKGSRKDDKSGSFLATAEKTRTPTLGIPSKSELIILEPPPELKGLIEKIVEFITRNGKQFEATLIEQDRKHGRFPFLLPSNQYNSYYLKVLQTAQESKTNGRSSSSKDDLAGRGDRKVFLHKKSEFSSLDSGVGDMPMESDVKEKFKMVIGKPKKDVQESRSKGTEKECGETVDAEAAAAILQAAIKGVNKSNLSSSNTSSNAYHKRSPSSDINHSEGNLPTSPSSLPSSQTENAYHKRSQKVSTLAPKTTLTASLEASHDPDQAAQLTEEQKVKAERLKRAKMFVSMLKSGALPLKNRTSHDSSVDPPESRALTFANEINITGTEGAGSSAPTDVERTATVETPERIYFGEEHGERRARRRYRSRSGGCEDSNEEDRDHKSHKMGSSRSKYKSRSRRHDEDDKNENETDGKRYRKKHRSNSSFNEIDDGESNGEDRDHECSKPRHRSRHSQTEDDGHVDEDGEVKDHKLYRKKHRSHYSSRKRRHSSKKRSDEENESDSDGRDHTLSRKKHRSQHSSANGSDKHRHRSRHSSGDKKSRHHLKHDSSSDDEDKNHASLDKSGKQIYDERDELEDGEINAKKAEGSRGITSDHVSRETSVGALIPHERAISQPPEATSEVPDDLRAKIRALLVATRL